MESLPMVFTFLGVFLGGVACGGALARRSYRRVLRVNRDAFAARIDRESARIAANVNEHNAVLRRLREEGRLV